MVSLLLLQIAGRNAGVDYSGLPRFVGDVPYRIESSVVTVSLDARDKSAGPYGSATFQTTTLFRNTGSAAWTAEAVIPRRRIGDAKSGPPTFDVQATFNRAPVLLTPMGRAQMAGGRGMEVDYTNDVSGQVTVPPGGSSTLRTTFKLPIGRAGYEQKQRMTGYLLAGDVPVGQIQVAFKYDQHTVFGLPTITPKAPDWQIGRTGAFLRRNAAATHDQLLAFVFYPGGYGGR